jgi:hypothetical protein
MLCAKINGSQVTASNLKQSLTTLYETQPPHETPILRISQTMNVLFIKSHFLGDKTKWNTTRFFERNNSDLHNPHIFVRDMEFKKLRLWNVLLP